MADQRPSTIRRRTTDVNKGEFLKIWDILQRIFQTGRLNTNKRCLLMQLEQAFLRNLGIWVRVQE